MAETATPGEEARPTAACNVSDEVVEAPPEASTSGTNGDKQDVPHAAKAWEFFRRMGSPKYHVAPMVDQKTRNTEDRPLLVQFCANDPVHLIRSAKLLEHDCDGIDINFGCPQRIAKRGFYGAFLMDNLQLVEQLVSELSQSISIPVTCKIRVFPELEKTLAYARMIERSGCCLLAVHGRTREQKDLAAIRADWNQIKAVKQALAIPVLANGNIRTLQDAHDCLEFTGCDGVLSAESLLVDPALFSPSRLLPGGEHNHVSGIGLLRDYLKLCLEYPALVRMVKGHIHKLIGPWLAEHTDLRDKVNCGGLDYQGLLDQVVEELDRRVKECGRTYPIAKVSDRALKRMEQEAAKQAAIEEQQRELAALAELNASGSKPPTDGQQHAEEPCLACCDVPPPALCEDPAPDAAALVPEPVPQPQQVEA